MTKLTGASLNNFTAFKSLELTFDKGINIYIGGNGTGKTHLLKVLYAACSITGGEDKDKTFGQKIIGVFHPYEGRPGRLAHRGSTSVKSSIIVRGEKRRSIEAAFSNHTKDAGSINTTKEDLWKKSETQCAYIPVKEMLAHAPGFLATVARRELSFEEVYSDIITRAYLPKLKGPTGEKRHAILAALQSAIEGTVSTKGEYFFLKNKQGQLEFTLLSEGMRKLALIWLLTQNGVLTSGSVLFWDEPEANLNPSRMGEVVEVMIELQRMGVQIFVSTHNYVLLKEFDLRRNRHDSITFNALFRDKEGVVRHERAEDYSALSENRISDTYSSLYDREITRSLGGLKI
ncbi:AAA family ATPase [Paracoccus sphaerophysae]|uniref:AAA family ATPase n=1 Tax=Paracoccus sphaerophysae TaxID=690417 RepID=UPI002356B06B|nr:ATP-binding protein [Paracoccus sphaerophysae]